MCSGNQWQCLDHYDITVRIWSLTDRNQEYVITEIDSIVISIAITADNELIVFGCGDGIVRIWSLYNIAQVAIL